MPDKEYIEEIKQSVYEQYQHKFVDKDNFDIIVLQRREPGEQLKANHDVDKIFAALQEGDKDGKGGRVWDNSKMDAG